MDDVDSRGNGLAKVFIIGSRPDVQGKKDSRRLFNFGNSFDVQAFLRFSVHHALQHAVHVADSRGEDVDPGRADELSRFLWFREASPTQGCGPLGTGCISSSSQSGEPVQTESCCHRTGALVEPHALKFRKSWSTYRGHYARHCS